MNASNQVRGYINCRNVFAGQLVALTINVIFDAYDEGFSVADADLGDQIISSGPFATWTVYDFLIEANDFIGGCSSNYSASQLNSVVSAINQNYVDGSNDNGYLSCPKKGNIVSPPLAGEAPSPLRALIFPNPFTSESQLEVIVTADSELTVEIFNYTGQLVKKVFSGSISANEKMLLNLNASELKTGIYFANITSNGKTKNIKLIIQK